MTDAFHAWDIHNIWVQQLADTADKRKAIVVDLSRGSDITAMASWLDQHNARWTWDWQGNLVVNLYIEPDSVALMFKLKFC
jgi:hypothetical protein